MANPDLADPPPGKVWACPTCEGRLGWNHRPACRQGGKPIEIGDILVAVYPQWRPHGKS